MRLIFKKSLLTHLEFYIKQETTLQYLPKEIKQKLDEYWEDERMMAIKFLQETYNRYDTINP